jgi:hypothetical protein
MAQVLRRRAKASFVFDKALALALGAINRRAEGGAIGRRDSVDAGGYWVGDLNQCDMVQR